MRQNFGISVVIPAHGRGEQLRHAIDSVRSRNPERVEILVIDDASPTMLGTLLPERNDAGIEVRSYRLQRNRGPAAARNLGIRRARFPYVALLDSDDRFTANKIDRVVEYLAAGDTDLLFHACRGMERYHHLAMFWWKRMRLMLPFPWLLAFYNPVVTPTLVFRRKRRLAPPSLRHCEDYAFLLNYVSNDVRVAYIADALTEVGRPQGSEGGLSQALWKMRMGEFRSRALLLRREEAGDLMRWAIGTAVGSLRVINDVVRGRYFR